jgi:hypothetical protein
LFCRDCIVSIINIFIYGKTGQQNLNMNSSVNPHISKIKRCSKLLTDTNTQGPPLSCKC